MSATRCHHATPRRPSRHHHRRLLVARRAAAPAAIPVTTTARRARRPPPCRAAAAVAATVPRHHHCAPPSSSSRSRSDGGTSSTCTSGRPPSTGPCASPMQAQHRQRVATHAREGDAPPRRDTAPPQATRRRAPPGAPPNVDAAKCLQAARACTARLHGELALACRSWKRPKWSDSLCQRSHLAHCATSVPSRKERGLTRL